MLGSPGEGGGALVLCRSGYLARVPVRARCTAIRGPADAQIAVLRRLQPGAGHAAVAFRVRAAAQGGLRAGRSRTIGHRHRASAGPRSPRRGDPPRECGLCEHGEQADLYRRGATEINGELPVNTDGGCIANGEPIVLRIAAGVRDGAATPGDARSRQFPNAPKTGFTHVYGASRRERCHGPLTMTRE